jgi:hypothetical protein
VGVVIERQECSVLRQWRIQRAATEHTGTDEIPESCADDVGAGEAVMEGAIRSLEPTERHRKIFATS